LYGSGDDEETTSTIIVPLTPCPSRRRRDIIQPTAPNTSPKRAMRSRARDVFATAIVDVHRWLDELLSDPGASVATLADRERKSERSIRMTPSLAFLASDLAKAALDGRLPPGFNTTRLVNLPMLWSEQWSALGLQSPMKDRA
jgi:site-specific DNA recombinase